MITRNDTDTGPTTGPDDLTPRRHEAHTEPGQRAGDDGRGSPSEVAPDSGMPDRHIGETHQAAGWSNAETAELDRSREEVVGSSGGEPRGPSQLSTPGEQTRVGDEPGLPLAGYKGLTVPEIIRQAGTLSIDQLRAVKEYEKAHRRRKTLLTKLERMLRSPEVRGGRAVGNSPDRA
jgi:hypothetical protein